VTPNSIPLIERHGAITINVGHGALGWTYAMGSAEEAAKLACGG
jgi:glycine/D-amino acid oxidase-like deaminating enzyme